MNLENLNVREINQKEVKKINGGFFPFVRWYYKGVFALAKHMYDNNIDVSGANYWRHGR